MLRFSTALVAVLAFGVSAALLAGGLIAAPQAAEAPPAESTGPASLAVTMRGFAYEPAYPTLNAGTTVTWTNMDREAHTVTSDGGLFDAEVGPGQTFSFTFDEPGIYFYSCIPHDWMIAEITVTAE